MAAPLATAAAVACGCVAEPGPTLAVATSAATVDAAGASGCTTAVVLGLSRQIADEISCAMPGRFIPFEATASLVFTSSAVLPYLQAGALDALRDVAATTTVRINSAFRTLPQQYLLYQWKLAGRCGITAAAPVGTSNHETGRALDLSSYPLASMTAAGWSHDIPNDDPHFEHLASDDLRGEDTSAFQRLWNRNHPEDPIATDGVYGSETAARLRSAPATGFPLGADCTQAPTGERIADLVAIDGPDRAPPSTRVHFGVALANIGQIDWPSTTRLVVLEGGTALRDPSWTSSTVITTLGAPIVAGAFDWIDFDVRTPAATTETVVNLRLALDDAGTRFGAIDLALTIMPDATEPSSGEGDEPGAGGTGPGTGDGDGKGDREPAEVSGGCAASGPGLGATVGLALIGCLRRRRRAR